MNGELDLWPKQHDLPAKWDGLPVEWGEWSDTASMFLCPPPKERCDFCSSPRAPLLNMGRVWTDPATAPPAIGRARAKRGKHFVGTISAFRCPNCSRDHVLDSNGVGWNLDITDYADEGSYER